METITKLFELDLISVITGLFLIISATVSTITLLGKFSEMVGKPFKWVKNQNKDHELLMGVINSVGELSAKQQRDREESTHHDNRLKNDLQIVSEKLDALSSQLTAMQHKTDETEMAKLKDSIVTYYRKYKDSCEWSRLESDAFWDLFARYEAHGGNGYIHNIVEPVMREITIVD